MSRLGSDRCRRLQALRQVGHKFPGMVFACQRRLQRLKDEHQAVGRQGCSASWWVLRAVDYDKANLADFGQDAVQALWQRAKQSRVGDVQLYLNSTL